MSTIDDLFKTTFSTYTPDRNFSSGYYNSHLDVLLQQAKRNKTIRESKIWDYIQVENDPNFSRRSPTNSKKIDKLISDLSMATTINTTISSKLSMMGVFEFIPENLQNVLLNFQQMADTNINALNNIKQLVTFKQLEDALLSDLISHYLGGYLKFSQIVDMSNAVLENQSYYGQVKNLNFKSILSLGLQNILPKQFDVIFETMEYLTLLDEIFDDDSLKTLVTDLFKSKSKAISNTNIGSIVGDSFSEITLSYDDPTGVNTTNSFISYITTFVDNQLSTTFDGVSGINTNDKNTLIDFVSGKMNVIVDSTGDQGIGMPNLMTVTTAISNLSNDNTLDAIFSALDNCTKFIISKTDLKDNTDTNTTHIDYLINIKKNIESRLRMSNNGAYVGEVDSIDTFLRTVLKNPKYTTTELQTIYDNLVKVLDNG